MTERSLAIKAADDRRGRDLFVRLPFALYRGRKHWIPPLLVAERDRIDPAKNPFFRHAAVRYWLIYRGREAVGRIAAIDDELHNRTHGENVAFFGFFEAADAEAAQALLEAAESWARHRGRDAVRGPANPSLNDTAGLQIDNYDTDPFVMTPYNPPEYPGYVEAAGYRKAKDLYSWNVDISQGVNERAQRIVDRIRQRMSPAPVLRQMRRRRFLEDAETVHRIFSEAWRDNWGFVPPTEREFRHAAKEMKPVMDRELALLLEIDGEPAAFSLTLPDLNQVFKRMNGKLLPFGIIKLLMRRRYIDQARMLLLGVLPEHRHKGLELMLIAESIERSQRLGYRWGECSWTLEDNDKIGKAIRLVGGDHTKTYRLYEKPLP